MEDSKDLRKKVAANLRSVTQSCKGGVPFECLEKDYRDLLGVSIPYKALGYSSLETMLRAMPDVVSLERTAAGKFTVMAVADDTTKHIASLIARQKSAKKPTRSRRPMRVKRAPAPSQRPSVRHFNKGSRAPPPYLESDFQAHSHSSSDQFQEPARSIPHHSEPLVHSPRQKAAPSTTFGPKFEIPPRFLRQQEKPLSSLENNSIDEQFGSAATSTSNYANRQPAAERIVTCGGVDSHQHINFVPPTAYKLQRTSYESQRSAREFIQQYAQKNNLPHNYHTVIMGQRQKSFVSILNLGDEKYRNYPDAEPTPEKAEEAVAEKARKAICEREDLRETVPVTATEDPAILDLMLNRIEQIVAEKPKGIWNTSIPAVYEEKFKERLPEDWLSCVKSYCSFYFSTVDNSRIILYPGSDSGRVSPASNVSNQDDDCVEDFERRLNVPIPPIQLPASNTFDVFVCNVQDVQSVAVRLIDYAEVFEELSEQMKNFYAKNKCPVSSIAFDKIYASFYSGLWHRAVVEDVQGDSVICHLVDEGDLVEISLDCLQEIDSNFTKVPFQAVIFKLAELEAYSSFVDVEILREYLLGKTLIAHLIDNSETIHLYDTSTDEDVNLNHIIFEKTVAQSLNYTLPECGSSAVGYISHVSPTGTVYLTFNSPSTGNLLLDELKRISPLCEQKAKEGCDIVKTSCVYCAKYGSDAIWYRAIILDTALDKGQVEVLYVDYGNTSWVPVSFVCELRPLSEYLAELPFQAIRCNLSELPPRNCYWSDKAILRLGELAPCEKELIVRVQKEGSEKELPEVSLFIRNECSQIVSINQTLAYDEHLFSQRPSGKHDRLPSWTKGFHSEFNTKEYTPLPSSPQRSRVPSSPAVVENATNGNTEGSLSNSIPDVAVSAEQQLAKRHGNWAVTSPGNGIEGESEAEEFPPLYPPDVPDAGNYFDIFITMAASPFNFMCQPLKSSAHLDQLFSEMQSFYSNEENLCEMHSVLVRQGEFFAAKHVDGSWYRVRKQSIVSEEPLMVSVYFVDYGDICIVSLPNLQPLFKQFKSLPCQCMKASLKGVRPNGHDWDPMECFEFKNMVEEKNFVSIIKRKEIKVEDHLTIYSLELVIIDVSDPKVDVLIHEELIKNKMAQAVK